jgi:NADH:ubiquinone oxidoreductase subunit 5 (subunit L)/multisubunit Na+/H+ antiporter MnhA subunit
MLHATGSQDLNQMGGLMKFMPLTAVTALVASFSISGVPLFNGFASKWSIYVATVQGSGTAGYLAVCAIVAILTSALTLASFIKFFGVSFLSRTSPLVNSQAAARGKLEVGWLMQLPQVFLAAFCVALGVMPAIACDFIGLAMKASPSASGVALSQAAPLANRSWFALETFGSSGVFAPVTLAIVLGLMFLLARGLSRLGSAPRRAAVPWLCGYAREAASHRYVAHNFYSEIKRYFRWLGGEPARGQRDLKKP